MQELVIGGTYRNYRGDFYKVLGIAKNSDTKEDLVVYIWLYPPKEEFGYTSLRARSKEIFLGEVEYEGKTVPHFKLIRDGENKDLSMEM